mmetsp:Transcript_36978/g.72720  ORF Transcript_36978/g.72720 Transcript_36978/m.72720 type:complete len:109 (+) Transcript_36978:62-388(+)
MAVPPAAAAAAAAASTGGPTTTEDRRPNPCQTAFEKFLDGLAAIGTGTRSAFTATGDCISRTAYPLKESCVDFADRMSGGYKEDHTRGGGQRSNVAHFEGKEGTATGS